MRRTLTHLAILRVESSKHVHASRCIVTRKCSRVPFLTEAPLGIGKLVLTVSHKRTMKRTVLTVSALLIVSKYIEEIVSIHGANLSTCRCSCMECGCAAASFHLASGGAVVEHVPMLVQGEA